MRIYAHNLEGPRSHESDIWTLKALAIFHTAHFGLWAEYVHRIEAKVQNVYREDRHEDSLKG